MAGRTNTVRRNSRYIYGANAEDFLRELEEAPRKKLSLATRRNQDRAKNMNLPYTLFLAFALAICAFSQISYVKLQSGITESINKVSKLENQYISLKIDNDEEYNRIVNAVDLDNVKKVAIEQLGMHYAKEGQIVTYTDEMRDYVRLYSDVEE